MLKPRKELPDIGELVVGTVKEVHDFGAYLVIDDYEGIRAFLPWSEVASRMVRDIRQVLKPGQKHVLKVIRVYKARKQVDVSLKRVMDGERRRKMAWFKRTLKAATLIEMVGEKLGKTRDEVYREVIWKLEDAYGEPMVGLEQALIHGRKALEEAGIPDEWIEPLIEVARSHVKLKQVKISGILVLRSTKPDGIHRIRKVLKALKEAIDSTDSKINSRVYSTGAPRYRVDLYSHDYKVLESALQRALERASSVAKEVGVELSFERLKE
ncbi:MAG: translation initiation factor IF-2 subunit alpha [Desulfurococcales archaeon]|nr:translation initiation factor IF-2 subunit alpha [Desulfurococcales archaeon]